MFPNFSGFILSTCSFHFIFLILSVCWYSLNVVLMIDLNSFISKQLIFCLLFFRKSLVQVAYVRVSLIVALYFSFCFPQSIIYFSTRFSKASTCFYCFDCLSCYFCCQIPCTSDLDSYVQKYQHLFYNVAFQLLFASQWVFSNDHTFSDEILTFKFFSEMLKERRCFVGSPHCQQSVPRRRPSILLNCLHLHLALVLQSFLLLIVFLIVSNNGSV